MDMYPGEYFALTEAISQILDKILPAIKFDQRNPDHSVFMKKFLTLSIRDQIQSSHKTQYNDLLCSCP
jgi:hypothetical protein